MEDLAQKLKEFRISTGLSQSEIAEKLDIPQTTWSGYERGRSNPSVNEQDYAGHFPLEEAVTKCCPVEILQYLVAQDADINPKIDSVNSEPPLLRAVGMQEASLETVQFLIKAGADIKDTDHYGQTVLMIAAHRVEDVQIINFLIKAGADIHVKEKNGMTALDYFDSNKFIREDPIRKTLKNATYKK